MYIQKYEWRRIHYYKYNVYTNTLNQSFLQLYGSLFFFILQNDNVMLQSKMLIPLQTEPTQDDDTGQGFLSDLGYLHEKQTLAALPMEKVALFAMDVNPSQMPLPNILKGKEFPYYYSCICRDLPSYMKGRKIHSLIS